MTVVTLTDEKKRGAKERRKSCRDKMSPQYDSPLSPASPPAVQLTHYGYPIVVKSLTLALSLEITARTLSGPAEFKGAAETPTVPAVTHYPIRLTQ